MQYNYTHGLILALIRRFQLLGMKAPQFGHGSPKRAGEGPVVESQAVPGLPLAVAPPDLRREGAYEITGVRARNSHLSKKCSAGDGKRIGSVIGVASVQGRPGEDRQAKRRQHVKRMVVE